MSRKKLEQEYRDFLSECGIQHFDKYDFDGFDEPPPEKSSAMFNEIIEMMKFSANLDGTPYDVKDFGKLEEIWNRPQKDLENEHIANFCQSIESAIDWMGISLPRPVFCGVFPTGTFNAIAVSRKSGDLLLINKGTFPFVFELLTAMSLTMRIIEVDKGGRTINSTVTEGSELREDEIWSLIALKIINYILHSGWIFDQKNLFLPSPARAMALMPIYTSCMKYMIAHEYGHAVFGHLKDPKLTISETNADKIETISKNWQQEFEADSLACELAFLSALDSSILDSKSTNKQLVIDDPATIKYFPSIIAGIMAFFQLADTVSRLKLALLNRKYPVVSETHPPSDLRGKYATKHLSTMIESEEAFGLSKTFNNNICRYTEKIVQMVSKIVDKHI